MPVAHEDALPVDEAWEQMVEIVVRPNGDLSAEQQEGVAYDYAMKKGQLRLTVRAALEEYVRAHLGLKTLNNLPPLLEEVKISG